MDSRTLDPQGLIMVVVGAHLQAELDDRPLGQNVLGRIAEWQAGAGTDDTLFAMMCTDLWYLNAQELMRRPTISIGPPEVNAASAYFANRLPVAFMIENTYQVQLDPELVNLQACVWGVDHRSTGAGVDLFLERYLAPFLEKCNSQAS